MTAYTPIYNLPYVEPSDLVATYPTVSEELAENIELALPTVGGLAPTPPTTIANSGGSASLTGNTVTFSGVSSVSLNGCFTGDYDNYVIHTTQTCSNAGGIWYFRLRVSGTDATTNYGSQRHTASVSTVYTGWGGATTQWTASTAGGSGGGYCTFHVYRPFLAVPTFYDSFGAADQIVERYGGVNTNSTSYTSFTIYPSAGTVTGTVSVYGYKK